MQRPPISIRPARSADRAQVTAALARAFADDPAMCYIFPDAARRARKLPAFFDLIQRSETDVALTNIACVNGTEDCAAAAIWRAPNDWQTPTSAMLRLAWPLLNTFGTALPRTLRMQSLLESHHSRVPHWYLAFLGCDPAFQGKGYGGAAVRARLATCDAEGLPAALETATESNLPIYTALGFVIADSFDVPGGPRFWSMWREPRAG
jgi:GNAT superfamily N-acetyltransferase